MSFREKTAWVTLIAMLIVAGMYFFHNPRVFDPNASAFVYLAMSVSLGAFVIIEILAYLVLYLRYPKDARTPKDERERLIDLKATRLAAYVYVVGSFLAIMTPHHGANAFSGAAKPSKPVSSR